MSPVLEAVGAKAASLVTSAVFRKVTQRLNPKTIDEAVRANYENMTLACTTVMRAIVAAKLGVAPDDATIGAFIDGVTEDPALVARMQRLFVEGAKSPSAERRHVLALALLGIDRTTPERDRIDAAIERLFPEDIRLLRDLVRLVDPVLVRVSPNGAVPFVTRDHDGPTIGLCPDRVSCPDAPLYALQSGGCAALEPAGGLLPTGVGNEMAGVAPVRVLPLGRAVLAALEATGVDLESVSTGGGG